MATDKLFTVAGVSTLNGEVKVRFANDAMRVKVLAKHGHENIIMVELPEAMSKLAAAQFLKELDEFQDTEAQAVIADYIERNGEKPAKPAKAPRAKAVKKAVEPQPVEAAAEEEEDDDDLPVGYASLEQILGEAEF